MSLDCIRLTTIMVVVFALANSSASFAIMLGTQGDGISDLVYRYRTGEILIDPDGDVVGAFNIESRNGIFLGDPAVLPAGLFREDSDSEISVGHFDTPVTDIFSLGKVAVPELSPGFLLQDLALAFVSGGFGTPTKGIDLIVLHPLSAYPPTVDDAALLFGDVGSILSFSFNATDPDAYVGNGSFSTTLANLGSGVPHFLPTIDADGNFAWDTIGSPLGEYAFEATFTDEQGLSGSGVLTVHYEVPEPTAMTLLGLAGMPLSLFRRRWPMA